MSRLSSAAEIDSMVATLLENSAAGRALTRAGTALEAAWAHSVTRSMLGTPRGIRAQITFASVTAVTAAVVALALAPLGSMPRPYAWIVPSVAAAIALVCLALRPQR